MAAKLGCRVIVQFFEVQPVNRPLRHSSIVCDKGVIRIEMFSFNSPSDGAWHAGHFTNDSWLVVDCLLLGAHLVGQEALKGWLIDPTSWLFNGFL